MTKEERDGYTSVFKDLYFAERGYGPAAPPLPPLTRPAELDNPATPQALREQIHSSYAAAITDRPNNTWTAEQRAVVHEETLRVLRGMNR